MLTPAVALSTSTAATDPKRPREIEDRVERVVDDMAMMLRSQVEHDATQPAD
jgi:hypothetical protein